MGPDGAAGSGRCACVCVIGSSFLFSCVFCSRDAPIARLLVQRRGARSQATGVSFDPPVETPLDCPLHQPHYPWDTMSSLSLPNPKKPALKATAAELLYIINVLQGIVIFSYFLLQMVHE